MKTVIVDIVSLFRKRDLAEALIIKLEEKTEKVIQRAENRKFEINLKIRNLWIDIDEIEAEMENDGNVLAEAEEGIGGHGSVTAEYGKRIESIRRKIINAEKSIQNQDNKISEHEAKIDEAYDVWEATKVEVAEAWELI